MSKNVMIVAGEASGDMYGAKVVEEAHRLDSSVHFFGIGGPKMREVGVDTVIDATEMAVMGLFEVIAHLPVILRAYKLCRSILINRKPDLLILIDYPGFNLRLAALAKKIRGQGSLFHNSAGLGLACKPCQQDCAACRSCCGNLPL